MARGERPNAPSVVQSSTSPGPPTINAAEIETMSAEASKQQPVVEVDEGTTTPNLPFTSEDPTSEQSSKVVAI